MKGHISLKDFILGVKKELQEASSEGSKNPFLELNQVELEAEFGLETSAGVEGGFSFFVKANVEAGASQSHKVKLIFSPINNNFMFAVSPSAHTDKSTGESRAGLLQSDSASPNPRGPYFITYPDFRLTGNMDVDEIVNKAVSEAMKRSGFKNKGGRGSGEDEA